ncbi:MAG: DUF120 domain-containing protein [Chloroflexota bacterium]|nr:DUF120 domain-containing protein [Chloroflexota bacterium]
MSGKQKTIRLRGTVISGTGEAGGITELGWVKKQFVEKLGIHPYPGTFNIKVLSEDMAKLNTIRQAKGIEITPLKAGYCPGLSFLALVDGKIKGAVIIPCVPNYPAAQLEIIAAENVRQALSVKDGDVVEVEVYL